jgi:hypothetical protein
VLAAGVGCCGVVGGGGMRWRLVTRPSRVWVREGMCGVLGGGGSHRHLAFAREVVVWGWVGVERDRVAFNPHLYCIYSEYIMVRTYTYNI